MDGIELIEKASTLDALVAGYSTCNEFGTLIAFDKIIQNKLV